MEYSYCKLIILTTHTIKVHNICKTSLLNTIDVPPINCMFFLVVHTNSQKLGKLLAIDVPPINCMFFLDVSVDIKKIHAINERKTWGKLLRNFINPSQTLKSLTFDS
jgi:hypothetical protein